MADFPTARTGIVCMPRVVLSPELGADSLCWNDARRVHDRSR